MRYEGRIFRPPSEAYSLIIQVTIGCAHNKCTFCESFKEKQFRMRELNEVLEDLDQARRYYRRVDKIFLADADALVLKTDRLLVILDHIKKLFPECQRIGIYGSARDIRRKTPEELMLLRDHGLKIVYIGAESGNPQILKDIKKGSTREEIITAVRKIEELGIMASVTFISGIGGRKMWRENAIDTGTMISEMEPTYASFLTLMVEPGTPLYEDWRNGKFELLKPEEVLMEAKLMLENVNVTKKCVFRSNHASNYLSLKGDLPDDKDAMLKQIDWAMENTQVLKDERFRAL